MIRFSVVIPTLGNMDLLRDCFRSLKTQTYRDFEVVVVDASANEKVRELCSYYDFKHIHSKIGISLQRNIGVKNSSGKHIVFIDDDAEADKNWLKNLSKKEFDMAYGKIINVGHFGNFYNSRKGKEKIGCNMAFRKECLEDFDERYSYGAEELDMAMRMKIRGFKIDYFEDAIVYHKSRNSFFSMLKRHFKLGKGIMVFHEKYKSPIFTITEVVVLMCLVSLMFNRFVSLTLISILYLKSFLSIQASSPKRIFYGFIKLLTKIAWTFGKIYYILSKKHG